MLADAQECVEMIVGGMEEAERAETSVMFDLCVFAELGESKLNLNWELE